MDFLSLVKKSRSYRSFDENSPIAPQTLEYLIECARFAPTGVNLQELKFYLSADKKTNAIIQPLTRWAGKLAGKMTLPPEGHMPTAFIVILVDTTIMPDPVKAKTDVGIAAQTILLSASSIGLGGCMIGSFDKSIRDALELPSHLSPALVVALGKPDEEIILEDKTDSIDYYRNEAGVHVVPKRTKDELIVK